MVDSNEMAQEYVKAYTDKSRIYFIEKYLSTFDGTEGRNVPFILFPRQRVYCEALGNDDKVITAKHRQCGISTTSCAWITGEITFARPDSPEIVLCIANKLDQAAELLVKIRDFLEQVPRWYWGDDYYSPDPKSEKNKKDIFIKNSKQYVELFNGCKIYAKAAGPNSARGVSSVSILIFDEAAFMDEGVSAYASAVAATSAVAHAKIIMVSTPNGKDPLYYQTYKQALEKKNGFTVVEFKWFQDLRYNRFLRWHRKNKKTGEEEWIVEHTIDDKGRIEYTPDRWMELERNGWKATSPWYVKMCESFNNDPMKIAQELDVSFLGSSDNVIPADVIEKIRVQDVCDPLPDYGDPFEELSWFWKKPIEGHRYILACLPEGEKVITRRGEVKVEDVTYEDELLTKDGKWTKIKKRFVRNVKDEDVVSIRYSNSPEYHKFTWNHPIYASVLGDYQNKRGKKDSNGYAPHVWKMNFDFHKANELQLKDWMVFPNIYKGSELTDGEINKYWEKYSNNGRIDYRLNSPLLDEDFWWYCGIWLAEGYCSKSLASINCVTCHNINEIEYHKKIQTLSERLFNRKATLTQTLSCHSTQLIISCKPLALFLNETFGKYAKHKFISEWVKRLPEKYLKNLISGYLAGDGYVAKSKGYVGFTSISIDLLNGIDDVLRKIGIISSIKLHVKEGDGVIQNKKIHVSNKYEMQLSQFDSFKLLKWLGIETDIHIQKQRTTRDDLFSCDKNFIYRRIKGIKHEKYTGKVYNFEVEDETHTFCCRGITTHNCDPSLGSSGDRTSIQVIDVDGTDEIGMPYFEQIMEYNGRVLGDKLGDMIYKYATLYNNAFVVVDATGGSGDACLLRLMNYWGYKNLYYDDNVMKNYLKITQKSNEQYAERMPGFHFQGNRFGLLRNFANMVTDGAFIIHSARLCNELDTWVFKGEDGRMDHMTSNDHDDNITCMAMALFILKFSFQKLEASKSRDAAILNAYMMSGGYKPTQNRISENAPVTPKSDMVLPFYNSTSFGKKSKSISGGNSYMWLMSGYY